MGIYPNRPHGARVVVASPAALGNCTLRPRPQRAAARTVALARHAAERRPDRMI